MHLKLFHIESLNFSGLFKKKLDIMLLDESEDLEYFIDCIVQDNMQGLLIYSV